MHNVYWDTLYTILHSKYGKYDNNLYTSQHALVSIMDKFHVHKNRSKHSPDMIAFNVFQNSSFK